MDEQGGTENRRRVLLLTTAHSYRSRPFMVAAEKLGVAVVRAVDLPSELAAQAPEAALPVNFQEPEAAVATIVESARERPFAAILAVDDSGALVAACAGDALALPHNDPQAAEAARDKFVMRQMLAAGDVPVPAFRRFPLEAPDGEVIAAVNADIGYPCVVKPRRLSGSRGVMRANDDAGLRVALARLRRLLRPLEAESFLIESYIPGVEVALEGMLDNGRLHVLALFDKPDPLEGPFFEETIYVTPSRLPAATQAAIAATTAKAAAALGLRTGPIHAELRINADGPWPVELAGRSIGGLCAQTLRFDAGASLEELIVRQAVGLPLGDLTREQRASGVMMIPIPKAGLLRGVHGVDGATAVAGVEEVTITARLHNRLVPLPEGESYLGFIFARGDTPAQVETALREAHGRLYFEIDPELPVL